jgi:hypothetical protein
MVYRSAALTLAFAVAVTSVTTTGCFSTGTEEGNANEAPKDSFEPRGAVPDKTCGQPDTYWKVFHPPGTETAGCTTLLGWIQLDSTAEEDLSTFGGAHLVTVKGFVNVFRTNLRTLRGLDNLRVVDGNLSIHLNDELTSLTALQSLREVTGNLYVSSNPKIPQSELDAFSARVKVGGERMIRSTH